MIYKRYILPILAGFLVIIGVSAFTFTGTPDELKQLQSEDVLGARNIENIITHGTLTAQGTASSTFGNPIIPDTNNTFDIGGYGSAFRNVYASGTIYGGTSGLSLAGHILPSSDNTYDIGSQTLRWNEINGFSASTTLLSVFSTVYIGGTVTSTLVTGNRGAATSTFYSDLSVVNRDVVIGGAANSGWLWVGDGTATTSIRGGTAGSVSSTLEGDTVIANLFSGTNIFDTDAGMVDAMDLPVSASAATGTLEGYNFPVDSKPLMSLVSQSDALGSVWAGYAGISTQSPSSSLHVANDFMGINNTGGTSTVTIGSDRMSPGCLVFQNSSRSGWIGCWLKSGDTTLTCAAITNVPNCQ